MMDLDARLLTPALLAALAGGSFAQIVAIERSVTTDASISEPFFGGSDADSDFDASPLFGAFDTSLYSEARVVVADVQNARAAAEQTSDVDAGFGGFEAFGYAYSGIYVQGQASSLASSLLEFEFQLERGGLLELDGVLEAGTTFGTEFGFDPHGSAAATLVLDDGAGAALQTWSANLAVGAFTGESTPLDVALELAAGAYGLRLEARSEDATVGDEEVFSSLSVANYELEGTLELLPALRADVTEVSTAAGGTQSLALDSGPALAGAAYVVLGSASGTGPGLALDGVPVPLVPDGYSLTALGLLNQAPFTGTLGVLDASGLAVASIDVPPGAFPSLAGATLNHAFVAFGPAGTVVFASNAAPLNLL